MQLAQTCRCNHVVHHHTFDTCRKLQELQKPVKHVKPTANLRKRFDFKLSDLMLSCAAPTAAPQVQLPPLYLHPAAPHAGNPSVFAISMTSGLLLVQMRAQAQAAEAALRASHVQNEDNPAEDSALASLELLLEQTMSRREQHVALPPPAQPSLHSVTHVPHAQRGQGGSTQAGSHAPAQQRMHAASASNWHQSGPAVHMALPCDGSAAPDDNFGPALLQHNPTHVSKLPSTSTVAPPGVRLAAQTVAGHFHQHSEPDASSRPEPAPWASADNAQTATAQQDKAGNELCDIAFDSDGAIIPAAVELCTHDETVNVHNGTPEEAPRAAKAHTEPAAQQAGNGDDMFQEVAGGALLEMFGQGAAELCDIVFGDDADAGPRSPDAVGSAQNALQSQMHNSQALQCDIVIGADNAEPGMRSSAERAANTAPQDTGDQVAPTEPWPGDFGADYDGNTCDIVMDVGSPRPGLAPAADTHASPAPSVAEQAASTAAAHVTAESHMRAMEQAVQARASSSLLSKKRKRLLEPHLLQVRYATHCTPRMVHSSHSACQCEMCHARSQSPGAHCKSCLTEEA